MRREYSPDQKAAALELLERNDGNISLTALQTGIADRTLYTWRQKHWLQRTLQRQNSSPPPRNPIPTFQDDFARLDYLRTQIMDELIRVTESFQDSPVSTTPHQRVLIVSHLLDQLMHLDAHLKPYRPKPITTIHVVGSEGQEPDGDEPDISGTTSQTTGDSEL